MKKNLIIALILLLLVAGSSFAFLSIKKEGQKPPGEKPKEEANIVVEFPKNGEELYLPIKIKGKARVFENVVNIRLKDAEGQILFEGIVMTQSPDVGQFGPFEAEISSLVRKPKDQNVTLEVYWESLKDGSDMDLVSIPLELILAETSTVKVFFNNNNLDPEFSCNKVFPTERTIAKTPAVGRAALEELLRGPTKAEMSEGFLTSINIGVKIQSLVIENETAKVDFDEQLEFQVGGSCRVSAIRAQITETLRQFPTVREVIISIDGRTEDILQP